MYQFEQKNGLGYILGDFLQTRPVALITAPVFSAGCRERARHLRKLRNPSSKRCIFASAIRLMIHTYVLKVNSFGEK
jgi:hypothetical protein